MVKSWWRCLRGDGDTAPAGGAGAVTRVRVIDDETRAGDHRGAGVFENSWDGLPRETSAPETNNSKRWRAPIASSVATMTDGREDEASARR